MSELDGQTTMDLSGEIEPVNPDEAAYFDMDGNLLPEPRQVDMDNARRLDVLAGEINLLEYQARETFKATAVEIGRRLIEAQGMVPRGKWEDWLDKNIHYSKRKAQQLMQVAEAYAGRNLPEAYDHLSFTQIYDLLAAPAEARDALAEEAAEEGLSTRELKERIKALEEQSKTDNIKIYDLIQQGEAKDRAIEQARGTAESEKKLAQAQRERAEKAEASAQKSAAQAKDAIERANSTAEELREARALIEDMSNNPPADPAGEVPEGLLAEMEDLRRQLAEAQAAAAAQSAKPAEADGQARILLALNLQVRLAIAGIKEQYAKAEEAIEKLNKLNYGMATARWKEVRECGEWIVKEATE